jgi:hypothetical protein
MCGHPVENSQSQRSEGDDLMLVRGFVVIVVSNGNVIVAAFIVGIYAPVMSIVPSAAAVDPAAAVIFVVVTIKQEIYDSVIA